MLVTKLTADHLRVPLPRPGKVSLTAPRRGGPDAVDLLLVRVETDAGLTGVGFADVIGPGAAVAKQLIDSEITPLVIGQPPGDTDRLFATAERHFRGVGFAGLPARAYAPVDLALWDLKAMHAGVPLAGLLGGARPGVPYFLTVTVGTQWAADDVAKAAKPGVLYGAMGVRVEVGGGTVQDDADRVRELHDALGDEAWLGVSAGGRYDLTTALALAHFFEDQGIDWFEDPIPADDHTGYARLADRLEIPLAVGATFDRRDDFFRVIRDGLARAVRPDPARLGGLTPVLKVAAVAEAYHVAVSPVRSPQLGVHLGCGLAPVPHCESVAWFDDVFAGGPVIEGGVLKPAAVPGLGVTVRDEAVAKYRAA